MVRKLAVGMCVAAWLASCALAQNGGGGNPAALERVLSQLDTAANGFHTAEADFVWDQYEKVVDETDTQAGKLYIHRSSKDTQMAANVTKPVDKHVLFADGKVRVYEPKINRVTEYNAGKNKQDFESFLVLGFGARGHDLAKSFDVRYAGAETVQGVPTSKLELIPNSPKVKSMFNRILLWIDLEHGISVQQQFFEPSGDYRLAKYTNIRINQHLPDDVFHLKTGKDVEVVRPQG